MREAKRVSHTWKNRLSNHKPRFKRIVFSRAFSRASRVALSDSFDKIIFSVYSSCIPANFFRDISVRFLSWEFWDFCRRHDHFRRFSKKSEVFRRLPKSAEGEVIEKTVTHKIRDREEGIVIYSFTDGFRSLHRSELTYFWKLCEARRQQLTFFNQAWEIGPQAWAGVRSKFSTRRRETHA